MSRCPYHSRPDPGYEWACTCQPPTLWGESRLWLCDCCEQPRAERRFTLCPVCDAHQYAHTATVMADHEDMNDDDGTPAALRGGGGLLVSGAGHG